MLRDHPIRSRCSEHQDDVPDGKNAAAAPVSSHKSKLKIAQRQNNLRTNGQLLVDIQ